MSKQDRQGVRTAQDVERKYKLGGQEKDIKYFKRIIADILLDIKQLKSTSDSNESDNTPYIMESGVSGDWHYEKWSNGISKCWMKIEPAEKIFQETTIADTYFVNSQIMYPSNIFSGKPTCINITPILSGDDCYASVHISEINMFSLQFTTLIHSIHSKTTYEIGFYIEAKGDISVG